MDDGEHTHLVVMMTEMVAQMQILLEKQDELGENIAKIKEAVYHPDNGLYARLSRLDSRLDVLEDWKNTNSKVLWLITTIALGLGLTAVWQAIF